MENAFGLGEAAAYVDGYFVDAKWKDLAQMLADYSYANGINPPLELRWIPPDKRTDPKDHTSAYAVVHTKHGQEYVVATAAEDAVIENVLTEVFMSDMNKHDVQARVAASKIAWEASNKYKMMQEIEERKELAEWMLKNPYFYTKYRDSNGELIKLDGDLRRMDSPRRLIT